VAFHELLDLRVQATVSPGAAQARGFLHVFPLLLAQSLIYPNLGAARRDVAGEREGEGGGTRRARSSEQESEAGDGQEAGRR
jgi:hypothetical protein